MRSGPKARRAHRGISESKLSQGSDKMLETPVAAAKDWGTRGNWGGGDENLFSGLQYKIQRTGYQEG